MSYPSLSHAFHWQIGQSRPSWLVHKTPLPSAWKPPHIGRKKHPWKFMIYTSKGLPCKGIDVSVWKTLAFFWLVLTKRWKRQGKNRPVPQIMKPLNPPNNAEKPVSDASNRFFQIPVQAPKLPTWSEKFAPENIPYQKGRCYVLLC